jgi:hypothetical protein
MVFFSWNDPAYFWRAKHKQQIVFYLYFYVPCFNPPIGGKAVHCWWNLLQAFESGPMKEKCGELCYFKLEEIHVENATQEFAIDQKCSFENDAGNTGLLKLFWLATPIIVFGRSYGPLDVKYHTKEPLFGNYLVKLTNKILSFIVWRPFSGNRRPSKGSRPLV